MTHPNASSTLIGPRTIIEAISSGKTLTKILINREQSTPLTKQLYQLAKTHNIPHSRVPLQALNRISKRAHQGTIAFVSPITFAKLSNIIQHTYQQGRNPLVILLDQLQDIRNLGAIARSALNMGADALVIPTTANAPISHDAVKASAGALHHLPICRTAKLQNSIEYLQQSGLQIVACSEKAQKSIYQANLTSPTALIFGGEHTGIAPIHYKLADHAYKIPTQGPISSLNVSVATSIFLYETMRQRNDPTQ